MTEMQTPQQENTPQQPEAVFPQKKSLKDRVMRVLLHPKTPVFAGLAILGVAGAVAFAMKSPAVSLNPFSRPAFVLFDPVRFLNSQRAAASILATTPDADTALTMTQVAKKAEVVIREEAHGSIVLIKQAVVAPDGIPDITTQVLERFGLPTNVPTITTKVADDSLEGVAPTDSAFSRGKLSEDYRLELQTKQEKFAEEQSKQLTQSNVLP